METDNTKKFNKLFSELEGCDDDEQKQKIEEIDVATNEMGNFDFLTVFTVRNCKMFENLQRYNFCISFLGKRFEKMIKEEWRKEVRNEKVLVDLCKCYVLLWIISPSKELLSICIPCLLKAALNKEKSEKTQKEVEMALFVLSNDEIYYV
ncbi:uncharacterized protein MONOS_17446 [Monocercomonoides exilis]|uniref:uncharacterized protein n=1 Tax=Monocercomonoides exilis TaxID=2049356 RepID=UPI00355A83F8|nr:hypothetical protein MONOS_17446 [Monocercomonoides exilis]